MNRRMLLPAALHTATVTVIALAATWITSLPVHSAAVSIATGATAALLANAVLPCPCHRRGHR